MRYDWIEIGTSDFRTEAETAKPTDVGLSVEPLRMYLDQLPSRPSCYKAYCAVSARCGEMDVYYIHPDDIEKYGLPKYVRGCNSVGEPHRLVAKLLEEHDVPKSIIQTERVRVVEREADDIKSSIRDHLSRSFFTLADRAETLHLVSSIDAIAEYE